MYSLFADLVFGTCSVSYDSLLHITSTLVFAVACAYVGITVLIPV